MKIRLCLRSDKLDMYGKARALELEEADLKQLAWHAACLEEDIRYERSERRDDLIEVLEAEAELLRKAVLEEREACLDWCAAFAADDGTAQKIAAAIRARGDE